MESIISGNFGNEANRHPERKGWFFGHFIKLPSHFFNNNFELKWGIHQKGEKSRKVPTANKTSKSLSILIKGKILVKFPNENKEITLSKLGDYIFWDANVFHSADFFDDSVIITIRWPSVPNDRKYNYKKF